MFIGCLKKYLFYTQNNVNRLYLYSALVLNRKGKLLFYCFLVKGIHPTTISESFEKAAAKAVEILTNMSTPVALSDRESLLKSAMTSLSSKVRVFAWYLGKVGFLVPGLAV